MDSAALRFFVGAALLVVTTATLYLLWCKLRSSRRKQRESAAIEARARALERKNADEERRQRALATKEREAALALLSARRKALALKRAMDATVREASVLGRLSPSVGVGMARPPVLGTPFTGESGSSLAEVPYDGFKQPPSGASPDEPPWPTLSSPDVAKTSPAAAVAVASPPSSQPEGATLPSTPTPTASAATVASPDLGAAVASTSEQAPNALSEIVALPAEPKLTAEADAVFSRAKPTQTAQPEIVALPAEPRLTAVAEIATPAKAAPTVSTGTSSQTAETTPTAPAEPVALLAEAALTFHATGKDSAPAMNWDDVSPSAAADASVPPTDSTQPSPSPVSSIEPVTPSEREATRELLPEIVIQPNNRRPPCEARTQAVADVQNERPYVQIAAQTDARSTVNETSPRAEDASDTTSTKQQTEREAEALANVASLNSDNATLSAEHLPTRYEPDDAAQDTSSTTEDESPHDRTADDSVDVEETPDDQNPQRTQRYRAPLDRSTNPRPRRQKERRRVSERGTAVDVRLSFERGNTCRVALVPRRSEGMPPRISVNRPTESFELTEMQEGWYEDVLVRGLGAELVNGVSWSARSEDGQSTFRWALGGRDVFALGKNQNLHSFVNIARLVLNETQAVLCTVALEDAVVDALSAAGASTSQRFDEKRGAPEGWIAFRDVRPTVATMDTRDGDPLSCLRPTPDAELSLEGGIRLQGSTWLAGFPPCIRLKGDAARVREVRIDNQAASQAADGAFVAPHWDALGTHLVASSVGSAEFTIAESTNRWPFWKAFTWTLEEGMVNDGACAEHPSVCGAAVVASTARPASTRSVIVPASNSVLVGQTPGEVEVCRALGGLGSKLSIGFPEFKPVWALPLDALHCDKRSVFLVRVPAKATGSQVPKDYPSTKWRGRKEQTPAARAWCHAILSASRKGLVLQNSDSTELTLWKQYRDVARQLARR